MSPTLTADQIAQFQREGYFHQPAVFDAWLTQDLRAELKRVGESKRAWATAWTKAEDGSKGFQPVRDLLDLSTLWKAQSDGVLHQTARAIFGVPVFCDGAVGIVKPPAIGQRFPPHQDSAYYGPINGQYVGAYIYLDDVAPDNGSLELAPGSHGYMRTHVGTGTGKWFIEEDDFSYVIPHAKAGDVVWFHLWIVHRSSPNLSDRVRHSVRVGYAPA